MGGCWWSRGQSGYAVGLAEGYRLKAPWRHLQQDDKGAQRPSCLAHPLLTGERTYRGQLHPGTSKEGGVVSPIGTHRVSTHTLQAFVSTGRACGTSKASFCEAGLVSVCRAPDPMQRIRWPISTIQTLGVLHGRRKQDSVLGPLRALGEPKGPPV